MKKPPSHFAWWHPERTADTLWPNFAQTEAPVSTHSLQSLMNLNVDDNEQHADQAENIFPHNRSLLRC
jgi:hypothetical protein